MSPRDSMSPALKTMVMPKVIFGVGLLALALNLLVVPYRNSRGILGYSFIGSPMWYRDNQDKRVDGEIDFRRIGLQSGAILLATIGVAWTASAFKRPEQRGDDRMA